MDRRGSTSLLLLSLFAVVAPYKFLLYDIKFQRSHVQFAQAVGDVLEAAGHEVISLANLLDIRHANIGRARTKYVVEQTEETKALSQLMGFSSQSASVWESRTFSIDINAVMDGLFSQCKSMLSNSTLIAALRAETFDVAYTNYMDRCAFALFHVVGLDRVAMADCHASMGEAFEITGAPAIHSYVPSRLTGNSEKMTFFERLVNFAYIEMYNFHVKWLHQRHVERITQWDPERLSGFEKRIANTSLFFMNRNSLVDFPQPMTHKIIEIGGATVQRSYSSLEKEWSDLLSWRPRNVLISFGTIALSVDMPESYKDAIRQLASSHPDVTIIWKYENPNDGVARNISNLVTRPWIPQKELIVDPRVSLFITHAGVASLNEILYSGVPVIAIPTNSDQYRNARVLERNGVGIVLSKTDLGDFDTLNGAVNSILEDKKYRENSKRVAETLADEPFSARERLIRNMEFLARHGPLHRLNHEGVKLNFFQYYLIDVFASIGSVLILTVVLIVFILRALVKCAFTPKAKKE